MEKINEKDVAKKINIDMFSWKKMIVVFLIIVIVATSFVLVWGFAFNGFLFQDLKAITKNAYTQIVLERNKSYCEYEAFTTNGKDACVVLSQDIESLYENEKQKFKFTPLAKIESVHSESSEPIFIVSDSTFKDEREIDNDEKFSNTIWFQYLKIDSNYKINHIFYKNRDIPVGKI